MNDFTSILENSNAALPSIATAIPLQEEKSSQLVEKVKPVSSIVGKSTGNQEKKRPRKVDSKLNECRNPNSIAPAAKKRKTTPISVARKPKVSTKNISSTPKQIIADTAKTKSKSITEKEKGDQTKAPTLDSKELSVRAATPITAPTLSNAHKATIVTPVATTPQVKKISTKIMSTVESTGNGALVSSEGTKDEKSSANSKECFHDIAKAAVANLMVNARGQADENRNSGSSPRSPVNISTAHIKALTSNSWVSACAASVANAAPGTAQAAQAAAFAASTAAFKAATNLRAKRASLTSEDRAKQARDRNREHARNTRLRKKAYVEELKRTLAELVVQRDTMDLERRNDMQRDIETRDVRFKVMNEFLRLRSRGSDQNLLSRWVAILGDGFTCTLPQVDSNKAADPLTCVLHGPEECFRDACEFEAFLHDIFEGSNTLAITYQCDRLSFMMDNIRTMMTWTLQVSPTEPDFDGQKFSLKGHMRASFIPTSNKLSQVELMFDTQNIKCQIQSIVQARQQSFPISSDPTSAQPISNNTNESNSTSIDTISPLVRLPPFFPTSLPETVSTTTTAIGNTCNPSPAPSLVSAESACKESK